MSIEKKLLGTNPSGGGLNVEDVFSTYLFNDSNYSSSPVTVSNGIDLAGEGGMVWVKSRTSSQSHSLTDTGRGTNSRLSSDNSNAEFTGSWDKVDQFNSDGFRYTNGYAAAQDYVSWTFRKAPKFFDVVTWTGDGDGSREISHNLGVIPGAIFCKRLDTASNWAGYHIGEGITSSILGLSLNAPNAPYFTGVNNSSRFSDTMFKPFELYDYTTANRSNVSGATYVAYLFAHNDGDGEFGPTGDQDIIKCGSYTTNGNGYSGVIDLGWEPQYVLFKVTGGADDWFILDSMRGFTVDGINDARLSPNTSAAEGSTNFGNLLANGFEIINQADNSDYIYMAIRRGPMRQPSAGTEVFAVDTSTQDSSFEAIGLDTYDALLQYKRTYGNYSTLQARLTGDKYLRTTETTAELTAWWDAGWDRSGEYKAFTSASNVVYAFKRAKGFFDVVTYEGDGTTAVLDHALSVPVELAFCKGRGAISHWEVTSPSGSGLQINLTDASTGTMPIISSTSATFTLHSGVSNTNGVDYIAYLFASLDGVSKVGSYTGNGSSQNVACGFSAGARFVLIKRTDSTGDWYIWDTERGIVTGNDPYLSLNSASAEVTSDDSIDPQSAGFTVNQVSATNINVSSGEYIFLAIA